MRQKASAGRVEQVEKFAPSAAPPNRANVVDLTELLKRSLGRKADEAKLPMAAKKAAKKPAAKKAS